jgi:hypothetical protein
MRNLLTAILCGLGLTASAQELPMGDAARLVGQARQWTPARAQSESPMKIGMSCLEALEGYSTGTGLIYSAIGLGMLPAGDGFYVLDEKGAMHVAFSLAAPKTGVANWFYELPVRFPGSDHEVTWVTYGYVADRPAQPIVSFWRDRNESETYAKIDLGGIKADPVALQALHDALRERIGTVHEDYVYYQKVYRRRRWPARSVEEYVGQLNACAPVQDDALQQALAQEKAKF